MSDEALLAMWFIGIASRAFACRWSAHGWEFWYALPGGAFDHWWGRWDGTSTLRSS